MAVCPNCGKSPQARDGFCRFCGTELVESEKLSQLPAEPDSFVSFVGAQGEATKEEEAPITRERIPRTSRLSGVGIEKFLAPGERIIFSTESQVWLANQRRRAYVTNNRVMFYYREPRLMEIIKEDMLDEMNVNTIRKISLVEKGLITKSIILHLDENVVRGNRGDMIGLYKAIQRAQDSG